MKELSYMIVIPTDEKDVEDPQILINRLRGNDHVQISNIEQDDNMGIVVDLLLDSKPYSIAIDLDEVEIPDFIRAEHDFTEEEIEVIEKTKVGVSVCMEFDDDCLKCFHDQLRIIDAMFYKIVAVLDCPAEKLLSGRWVSLVAISHIPPAPRYLFTVQAIMGGAEDEEVWLHTHGLKRCGLYELEILGSNREMYNEHYNIIATFASRMIESEEMIEPGEGVFIARAEDYYVVCTAVDWREAIKYYPYAELGKNEDRADEVHSEDTYAIMLYKNPQDEEDRIYSVVQEYDIFLKNNPMYMISTSETERMRRLAIERVPYLLVAAGNKENDILIKIGLETDEEYWDDGVSKREHIWFELLNANEEGMTVRLTQNPYYISGLKEGDVREYTYKDITDWIIYTKNGRITPDEVYLLGV